MASGEIISNTGVNLNLVLKWSTSVDTPARTVDVTVQPFLRFTSLEAAARTSQPLTIDGTGYTYNAIAINDYTGSLHDVALAAGKTKTIQYYTATDKTINISGSWAFNGVFAGVSIGTITASGSAVLDTLPPANTPPYWPTGKSITADGATGNKIIPENQANVTVAWTAAADAEGGTLQYQLNRLVYNSAGSLESNTVVRAWGTSRSYVDTSPPSDKRYRWRVQARDPQGAVTSEILQTGVIRLNELTGATATPAAGVIEHDTSSKTVTFSGAKNTNGNASFSYAVQAVTAGVTVYNPTAAQSSPFTLSIWDGSGGAPAGVYITRAHIMNALSGSNYAGTITLRLKTDNIYGASKTVNFTLSVDLRSQPGGFSVDTPTGFFTIGGADYYIPNLADLGLSWDESVDNLGLAVKYDVYSKLGTAAEVKVASDLATRAYSLSPGSPTAEVSLRIRVVAKTTYGTSREKTITVSAHYHYPPTVTFNPPDRSPTEVAMSGTIKMQTSIPGIVLSALDVKGVSGSVRSITAVTPWSDTDTGLTETDQYTYYVYPTDNSGLSNAQGAGSVAVQRFKPVLSVREKGLGVFDVADDTYAMRVGGKVRASDGFFQGNVDIFTGGASLPFTNMPYVGAAPIVERGSNANGHYIKFADGTLICRTTLEMGSIVKNGAGTWGDPYKADDQNWTFPAAFSVQPTIAMSGYVNSGVATRKRYLTYYQTANATTLTAASVLRIGSDSSDVNAFITVIAIGISA